MPNQNFIPITGKFKINDRIECGCGRCILLSYMDEHLKTNFHKTFVIFKPTLDLYIYFDTLLLIKCLYCHKYINEPHYFNHINSKCEHLNLPISLKSFKVNILCDCGLTIQHNKYVSHLNTKLQNERLDKIIDEYMNTDD